jgi:hypothetical protein
MHSTRQLPGAAPASDRVELHIYQSSLTRPIGIPRALNEVNAG